MLKQSIHDAIGRRKRTSRTSIGKAITLQPRDWLWLQKLHQHGPLSSSFLHAFSEDLCKNKKRARDRLTDLYNEAPTKHGGAYLERPWQQFETFDARYQELVYDLATPGISALKQQGLFNDKANQHSGPWKHKMMVASITASIELAAIQDPNVNFISQHQILARADADLRFPIPIQIPRSKRTRNIDLIPDALFGLEYLQERKKTYRFFIVEADRGTEPSRASDFNRKSHLRNFEQYRHYIGNRLYKDHLNLTAGLLVLHVTKDEVTLNRMLKLADNLFENGNSYMLFQSAEEFNGSFKPVKPNVAFLRSTWKRSGFEDFRIDLP